MRLVSQTHLRNNVSFYLRPDTGSPEYPKNGCTRTGAGSGSAPFAPSGCRRVYPTGMICSATARTQAQFARNGVKMRRVSPILPLPLSPSGIPYGYDVLREAIPLGGRMEIHMNNLKIIVVVMTVFTFVGCSSIQPTAAETPTVMCVGFYRLYN